MISLSTTDNNLGKSFSQMGCAPGDAKSAYRDLSRIANAPLGELAKANPNLLVFPKVLGENKDDVNELPLFTLSGSGESEGELAKVKITTGNLMGFVGSGGTELEITSRFTPHEQGEPNEDFFLHYMLEKVFALNLFDLKHLSGSGTFDFLLFLFPSYLQKALSQGIYKTYRNFKKNDTNMRGTVDVGRHMKENIPFRGRISYDTRERTGDNDMTELIRHTIEVIKTNPLGKSVLFRNEETRRAVESVVAATPSYNAHERERIISKNAKPINHAFYTAYRPLQRLCLSILRHEKLKYGSDSNQVYGILFDGAWLWEEYLATILSKCGFKHPRNKESAGGIRMFRKNSAESSFENNGRRIYPDFYRVEDSSEKGGFVIDAKYKRLQNGVGRDDLYQIVTYMHTMELKDGGFIYPIDAGEKLEWVSCELAGMGGIVSTIGFPIPKAEDAGGEFAKKMRTAEDALTSMFNDSLKKQKSKEGGVTKSMI